MELNKIYQGDSLLLLKELPNNSVDLVITSPPYSSMKTYINNKGIHPDKYVDWFLPFCQEIERVIKPTGSFILNINDKVDENGFRHPYVFDLISRLHSETNLKMVDRLFWNKMKSLPIRNRFSDRVEFLFWFAKTTDYYFDIDSMRTEYSDKSIKRMKNPLKRRFARTENDDGLEYKNWKPNSKGALPTTLINISSETKRVSNKHVAVYPTKLVEYFIKGSTKEGDLVLDPFSGTGTTALVAKNLNRNWLGFELEMEFIAESEKRINGK